MEVGKETKKVIGKWDNESGDQDMSRRLTRLRSVVLPLASALPASPLVRFVNAPTLLPMLLLKRPLLPELDMTAANCVGMEDGL